MELSGPFKTVLRNISETSRFRQTVFTLNEIFYVIWEVRDNTFYCVIFHIGPKRISLKYKYRFRLSKKGGSESISYFLKTSSFMDDVEEVIESGNCVAIHYNCIENFIKSGALPFEIYIFHHVDSKLDGNIKENLVNDDFSGSDSDNDDDDDKDEAVDEAEDN